MSNDNPEQSLKRFDVSNENRKFEIDLLWTRSNFFWGFATIAFGAFGVVLSEAPRFSPIVAAYGLVSSLAWYMANRASTYWQRVWERNMSTDERAVLGKEIYNDLPHINELVKNQTILTAKRFSLGATTVAFSLYNVGLWILLGIISIFAAVLSAECLLERAATVGSIAILFLSVVFSIWMWRSAESTSSIPDGEQSREK